MNLLRLLYTVQMYRALDIMFIDPSRLTNNYYNELLNVDTPLPFPCGWFGSIHTFLSLSKSDWLSSLQAHHQRCMNSPADQSQILAWDHSFDILQRELKQLVQIKPAFGNYAIIFEYELPRERGRRPDVIILGPCVFRSGIQGLCQTPSGP